MARLSKAEKAAIASEEKQYFVQIPNEFFDLGLSPYELAAYSWMKRRYGEGKHGVFESVSNMAQAVGMSTRRFHTAIDRLMEVNVIRSEGKTLTVKYIIHDKSVWKAPPSAPDAEVKSAPSAPDAEQPLHEVQKDSARGADKVDTTSRYQEEERKGSTPQTEMPATSPVPSPSLESQVDAALADPESPEARAFLESNGIRTDQRPVWQLRKFLRQTLGDQADHPQVVGNLTAWAAAEHSLQDVRAAWLQAVARRKREPGSKLRPVHHFVDILNGNYRPDNHDLRMQQEATAAVQKQAALTAPQPGDRVRLPDGAAGIVHEYLVSSDWLIVKDENGEFININYRPNQVQVIQ